MWIGLKKPLPVNAVINARKARKIDWMGYSTQLGYELSLSEKESSYRRSYLVSFPNI